MLWFDEKLYLEYIDWRNKFHQIWDYKLCISVNFDNHFSITPKPCHFPTFKWIEWVGSWCWVVWYWLISDEFYCFLDMKSFFWGKSCVNVWFMGWHDSANALISNFCVSTHFWTENEANGDGGAELSSKKPQEKLQIWSNMWEYQQTVKWTSF